MRTFESKEKRNNADDDQRRGDRSTGSFHRDDAKSFNRNAGGSPFAKDKRPRISRPAGGDSDQRANARPAGNEEGGERRSYNPNFTKDNRKIGGGSGSPYKKSYPKSDRDNDTKPWNKDNREGGAPKPWNKDNREGGAPKPWNKDNREGGAPKPWNKDNREGGAPKPWNKDNREGGAPKREYNREGGAPKREYNREGGAPKREYNREGGAPKREYNREGGAPKREYNREGGAPKPWNKDNREGGAPKREYNREGGAPQREYNREGGAPKPWNKDNREGGAPKPWNKDNREGGAPKPWNKEGRTDERGGYKGGFKKEGGFHKKPFDKDNYPKFNAPRAVGAVRLNRFIATSGVCSRREADDLIAAGVVTINGKVVTEMGSKVNPNDEVRFNGEVIRGEKKIYIVMNKPKGFVTTLDDPHADKTVIDLIKNLVTERVYPVGRLDKNSVGVLLITNDGEMTRQMTHPSFKKKKIYQVSLDKPLTKSDLEQIAAGIELEDGMIHVDEVSYVQESKREVGVEIHSGRNRIVRRIFESLGYTVQKLDRVYFAGLTKKSLKRGAWRFLTPREVSMLKSGEFE